MNSNQYAIELVTYLLLLVVYFYELIVYMLLERNAFDSIAFCSQCIQVYILIQKSNRSSGSRDQQNNFRTLRKKCY